MSKITHEDYEYYHVDNFHSEDDFFEENALLCALELWEHNRARGTLRENSDLYDQFSLYYGVRPEDSCYSWLLHRP